MRIYVCDDNELDRERVCRMLLHYARQFTCRVKIRKFVSAGELLSFMKKKGEKPDLVFLDIYMDEACEEDLSRGVSGIDGMEAGEKLSLMYDEKIPVIFSTSSEEHAILAFQIHAAGYLHKPYTQTEFNHAMKRVEHLFISGGRFIEVWKKDAGCPERIYMEDIVYIESERRGSLFHLYGERQSRLEVRSTVLFREYREQLKKEPDFFECGRSYLISLRHAAAMEELGMRMDNGDLIPVPVRVRAEAAVSFEEWKRYGRDLYL